MLYGDFSNRSSFDVATETPRTKKGKKKFNISRYIKKALVANERYQKQKCITALTLATANGRIAIKTNINSSGIG